MLGIINYGMGNLASVKNALDALKIESEIIAEPSDLKKVKGIILPGVGAFGMAMENLTKSGFAQEIPEYVGLKKMPLLGVCLGMQLLFNKSEEHGVHNGLGLIRGDVRFFGNVISGVPIPHMGWNSVTANQEARLFKGCTPKSDFYFVHSYYCSAENTEDVAGVTDYQIDFHSSVESGNIFGCQFHPEKSQKEGLQIYKNFNDLVHA